MPKIINKLSENSDSKYLLKSATSSDSKKTETTSNIINNKSRRISLLNIVFKFISKKEYYIY